MYWRSPYLFVILALAALATIGAVASGSDIDPDIDTYLPYLSSSNGAQPGPTSTATTAPTATATTAPTATATTAPTATATGQPTPTATVTGAPEGVTILENSRAYRDSIDAQHIVGEVVNGTQTNVKFVKVTANLFDAKGELVETDLTYAKLSVLAPGQKTCFHSIFYPGPGDWDSYELEVEWRDGGEVSQNLVITQHSASFNALDWYVIEGMIRNDNSQTVESVESIATVYDKSGRVIGCDSGFMDNDTLGPGQSTEFEHMLNHVEKDAVDAYRLQTDGDLQPTVQ